MATGTRVFNRGRALSRQETAIEKRIRDARLHHASFAAASTESSGGGTCTDDRLTEGVLNQFVRDDFLQLVGILRKDAKIE